MDILKLGDTERVVILAVDVAGAPVTGATVTLTIRRDSDGFFWNGTAFQSSATTVPMAELDATNMAGVYSYDFRPGISSFTCVLYATSATAAIVNEPWVTQLRVGSWADNLDAALSNVAGSGDMSEILTKLNDADRNYARIVALINRLSSEIRREK